MKVEEKLAKGWGGENAYHVGGYRYLLVDGDRYVSRAYPAAKAATLAKVVFCHIYTRLVYHSYGFWSYLILFLLIVVYLCVAHPTYGIEVWFD